MENIKHSGVCETFETGAKREDKTGKGRCDLLPPRALIRLSKHYEAGGAIYGDRNWEKGIKISKHIDSGIRHLLNYLDGKTDEDHLCAAAWQIMCAMETEEKRPEMQDIPARIEAEEAERVRSALGLTADIANKAVPDTRDAYAAFVEAAKGTQFYLDSDGKITAEGD